MNSSLPIGIFDSGVGGLSVARSITKVLPYEKIIYYGDTEHLPYGEKSNNSIILFSKNITNFLIKKKCKIIIIACNSASTAAYKELKKINNKIKIINVVDPVVEEIKKINKKCNIGLIGTKCTVNSKNYEKKINKSNIKIFSLATPLLAPMIEEKINENLSTNIIANYLSNNKFKNINKMILGCTHYHLIRENVKLFFKNEVEVLNSNIIVSKYVKNYLINKNLVTKNKKKQNHEFYVSNYTNSFEKCAKLFFKQKINLKQHKIK
tara:strand:+ start:192 stop:986 length:795 start_codon:yes stop_codon:yes gene_type:complete